MNMPVLPQELRSTINGHFTATDMAELRERLPDIPDISGFERAVCVEAVSDIVMDGRISDFDTVWQYGRLLHNMGHTRDATAYFELAHELQPDNTKVLGRMTEAFLELHEEMPNQRYDILARFTAGKLAALEDSDYSRDLYSVSHAHAELRNLRSTTVQFELT